MFLLGSLPETFAYAGIAALGRLYFRCSRKRQRYALEFLRQAYPEGKGDAELRRIGRVATGNFLKVSMDMIRVHRLLAAGKLEERIDGIEELRRRFGGKGVLIVTGHLGSWEAGGFAMALATKETHAIVRVFKNPLLQGFIERTRRAAGLHIHSRRGGIRGLARALRRGAVCLQVVDQNQRLRGAFVPFFGRIASTERSAATLAVRQGYRVAMCSCIRTGVGFRFEIRFHREFEPEPVLDGDTSAAVLRLVRKINAGLEEAILAAPEQYCWIHERYRTQPKPGEPEFGGDPEAAEPEVKA